MNARQIILIKRTKESDVAQEPHNRASIITEATNHGACGFITLVNMEKNVCVRNTHIADHTLISFTVRMRVVYTEQMDFLGHKGCCKLQGIQQRMHRQMFTREYKKTQSREM